MSINFSNQALFSVLICSMFITGCSKREKRVDEMSFDELKTKTVASLNANHKTDAMGYLEHMLAFYPDHENVASYKLMLADLYYKKSRNPQAFELYCNFHDSYPSDPRSEYAFYRAILSKYNQSLSTDCDDSETKLALSFCKSYLDDDRYMKYQQDVLDIKRTCDQKLIDKEVYVYNFYLGQGKFQSAAKRIEQLREKYLAVDADLAPRILYLEGKLAKRQKQLDEVKEKVEQLVDQYPDSQYTRMARGLVTNEKGFFIF